MPLGPPASAALVAGTTRRPLTLVDVDTLSHCAAGALACGQALTDMGRNVLLDLLQKQGVDAVEWALTSPWKWKMGLWIS